MHRIYHAPGTSGFVTTLNPDVTGASHVDLQMVVVSSYTLTVRRRANPQATGRNTRCSMMMSATSWLSPMVVSVCLALCPGPAVGQTTDATRHVRAFDPALRGLLDEGIERSVTFHRLVQRIDETDGIVYVESGTCSIGAAMGCLMLAVREAGHTRYLSIHLPPRQHRRDTYIALTGHELQHASEVLTARWVRNSADAYALFIRIGSAESIRSFETAEAQRVGALIAQELAACPRTCR